mmetsp:Transcript_1859/g.6133  ORF Transcript_1859/g.6133 Transcript_1859/m.6133 type:complete len:280 (-) Transcript_1859:470-1309(-)
MEAYLPNRRSWHLAIRVRASCQGQRHVARGDRLPARPGARQAVVVEVRLEGPVPLLEAQGLEQGLGLPGLHGGDHVAAQGLGPVQGGVEHLRRRGPALRAGHSVKCRSTDRAPRPPRAHGRGAREGQGDQGARLPRCRVLHDKRDHRAPAAPEPVPEVLLGRVHDRESETPAALRQEGRARGHVRAPEAPEGRAGAHGVQAAEARVHVEEGLLHVHEARAHQAPRAQGPVPVSEAANWALDCALRRVQGHPHAAVGHAAGDLGYEPGHEARAPQGGLHA